MLQGLDLAAAISVARRQAKIVIICAILGLTLGTAYGIFAIPRYTAQVDLLIDTRQIRAVQDISIVSNPTIDATLVDNQVEVIQSERVLSSVIRTLNLAADPEFNGQEPDSFLSSLMGSVRNFFNPSSWFPSSGKVSADPAYRMERTVIGRLAANMDVVRAGRSNVVQIAVTSKDSAKAALIANGLAEAYLADQLTSRFDAAKLAGNWLQQRIEELREQSVKADTAVERYRVENNLLATNGQLVSDQQLASINDELSKANAEVSKAKARYDSLKAIMESGRMDGLVSEALDSTIINRLRQQIIDATQLEKSITAKLGANHQQSINLRKEIDGYQRQIFEELGRISAGYANDVTVSRERLQSVLKALADLKQVTATANSSQVRLRQLEQEAAIYKTLYQSFLQRYQETIQQESFPMNDARIITDASKPLQPSEPRKPLLAALGLLLGLGAGVALSAFREFSDRTFRTPEQVTRELGIELLGMLPDISHVSGARKNTSRSIAHSSAAGAIPGRPRDGVSTYTINNPFSSYAETLRSVKVAIDLSIEGDQGKIIGIASSIPQEGKSTVAKNFASLLAMQGSRVILIDGDLRQGGLTRLSVPDCKVGLIELLLEDKQLIDVLTVEPETGLTILPACVQQGFFQTSEVITSPAMVALLKDLTKNYDYIVVDLPPLGPVTDGRAVARLMDGYLFVIGWGSVPRHSVVEALNASPAVREKIIGAVLNNVELKKLRRYQPYVPDDKQVDLFNQYYR